MGLILYHGSNKIVGKPIYGKGKRHNDYGRGFYCTESKDLAQEWAVTEGVDGFINRYRLSFEELCVVDLNDKTYTPLHWLSVLLQNRIFDITTPLEREAKRYILDNFQVPYETADIVKGYRADDSYFSYARDFIGGLISYEQLKKALVLGNLGCQICLKSRKAFEMIEVIDYGKVLSEEWFPKKMLRDQNARAGYRDMEKEEYRKGELYMTRLLDEEVKADDLRLR